MAGISEIVGSNIARERAGRGLSQAQLADEVEVKPITVYRWEAGQAWPTAKNVEALAKVFKIPTTSLFAGGKEPPRDPKVREALATLCKAFGFSLAPSKLGRVK